MLFDKALIATLAASTALASPIYKRQSSMPIPVKGVNIGGWLVLEPWITPSIFQAFPDGSVVDEYSLCQKPGAQSILEDHWSSWATEADFQKIAGAGLNLVRIPVGYWAFQKYGDDTYIKGAAKYLEQAVGWAGNAGLKVWIDLHGAPLSQNGFDNSGQRILTPQWTSGDTISFTNDVIGQIADAYADNDAVVGIELINEPLMASLPGGEGAVKQYYQAAYDTIAGRTGTVINDGFSNPPNWNGFLSGPGGVVLDHHEYQVFSNDDVALSYQEHVDQVSARAATWATGQDKYLINGEWTAAMTDCAPALNGYGIGARYDGTYSKRNADGSYDSSTYVGSCASKNFIDQWDDAMKTATTNYISAQINTAESMVQGWIFWNFKTEAAAEWDFFRLLDNGVWPS